eukprot:TRINITY_DN1024_c0_g1_i1.p1 TRINITY_DN1024_c0_g1~~TRINITY_DN1024_c0_g1_i1.p1  ORF type:complete len:401 (-),score=89.49 TRINITY_DN1024_c0_g1_i1:68-1270(-)
MSLVEAKLEVLNCLDSEYTRVHDLVSHDPVRDLRNTFSHFGHCADGLKSGRNINFKSTQGSEGHVFWRDHNIANHVFLHVIGPSTRFLVHEVEFDTTFFEHDHVRHVYSVILFDQLKNKKEAVITEILLESNSKKRIVLHTPTPTTRIALKLGEGGLSRFRLFGTPLAPLPPRALILKDATIVACSDAHYGQPSLVLREQREGFIMAGWESARHAARQFIIFALAKPSAVHGFLIDTYMHLLNNFRYVTVLACNSTEPAEVLTAQLPKWQLFPSKGESFYVSNADLPQIMRNHDNKFGIDGNLRFQIAPETSTIWHTLLPVMQCQKDSALIVEDNQLVQLGPVTHLAVFGIPDGGFHRLIAYGDFIKNTTPTTTTTTPSASSSESNNVESTSDALAKLTV